MSGKRKEAREQRNKLLEGMKKAESDDSSEEDDDDDFDEEGDNVGDSDDGWSNSSESEMKTIKNNEKKSEEIRKKQENKNKSEQETETDSSTSSEDTETPRKEKSKEEKKSPETKAETRESRSSSEDYRQSELYKQLEAFKSPDRVVVKREQSVSNLRKSGSAIEHTRVTKYKESAPIESPGSMDLLLTKLEENSEKTENNLEENLGKITKTKSSEESSIEDVATRPRSIKISGSEIKSKSDTGGLGEKAADDLQVLRVRVTKQKTQSLEISKAQVENILATGGRSPVEERASEKSPLAVHKDRDRVSKGGSDISHYAQTSVAAPSAAKKSKHRRIKSINSVKTKLILKGKFDEISILPHSKSTNVHIESSSSPLSPPGSRRKSGKGSAIQSFSLNDVDGAPDTKGKGSKVTQAELDLLKEVEEREALKANFFHPESDKKMKKKLKLEENQAEEQRKLQQLNHLQSLRNKNKSENLLPENDPDPANRYFPLLPFSSLSPSFLPLSPSFLLHSSSSLLFPSLPLSPSFLPLSASPFPFLHLSFLSFPPFCFPFFPPPSLPPFNVSLISPFFPLFSPLPLLFYSVSPFRPPFCSIFASPPLPLPYSISPLPLPSLLSIFLYLSPI